MNDIAIFGGDVFCMMCFVGLQTCAQSYMVRSMEKQRELWIGHWVQIPTCHFLAVRDRGR